MDAVWALVVLALFAGVLGGLVWVAARARRGGTDSSMMGPFEEIWHPAAHRARNETQTQHERPAPAPSPGDRLI